MIPRRGACVDVFAPGVGIVSAVPESDTAVGTKTGTSMAARARLAALAGSIVHLRSWIPKCACADNA